MKRRAPFSRVVAVAAVTLAAVASFACRSNSKQGSVQVLDPTQPHYGHTNSEWGALWWQWIYQLPQTDAKNCIIPFMDPTGANCGHGQTRPDTAEVGGNVFFLAGTAAGKVVRNQCVVPFGKAIFFPILSFSADNAGVPVESHLSDAALQGYVRDVLQSVPPSALSAEFDGVAIPNLARFQTDITPFSYTLPPEPNVYTCQGQTGVTGTISAYAGGFFVMLAPPTRGPHTLHFAGRAPMSQDKLETEVTYNFMVR